MGCRQFELWIKKKKMVPLEDRLSWMQRVKASPKLSVFQNLIYKQPIILPIYDISDIEAIYYGICSSINNTNKVQFEEHYSKISRRVLNVESPAPFIHDDFLIFVLIIGIVKFNFEKGWIKNVIQVRRSNPVTNTFDSLLNENYVNKSNLHEISLTFLFLIEAPSLKNELINDAYKSVSLNIDLLDDQNGFHVLTALRSYDLAIELKMTPEESSFSFLTQFERKFVSRMKIISVVFYNACIVGIFFGLYKLLHLSESYKEKVNDYTLIIGVVGVGTLGSVLPIIRKNVNRMLLRLFGYKKQ